MIVDPGVARISWLHSGLFLPIFGKSNFFFSWEFSLRSSEVVSYWERITKGK